VECDCDLVVIKLWWNGGDGALDAAGMQPYNGIKMNLIYAIIIRIISPAL